MSFFLPSKCVACKREKWFTYVRVYKVPKDILKKSPHLASLQGMTSQGELCNSCFKALKRLTNIM